jgi:hypothetical protein
MSCHVLTMTKSRCLTFVASEVSDDQVITQVIKALHAIQLHNNLSRERTKTVQELYEIVDRSM